MIAFPPDITFIIQIISFVLLWQGLKRVLFDPILAVIDERRARTTGVLEEAALIRSAALASESDFDGRMVQVRDEIGGETDAARHATDAEERQVLATARDQAAVSLKQQRGQIRVQAEAARSELAGEAGQLAHLIVAKVVGGVRA